eukprot:gene24175-10250_t
MSSTPPDSTRFSPAATHQALQRGSRGGGWGGWQSTPPSSSCAPLLPPCNSSTHALIVILADNSDDLRLTTALLPHHCDSGTAALEAAHDSETTRLPGFHVNAMKPGPL